MTDQKYHLTYSIQPHPEGITEDQISDKEGACDSVVICSVQGSLGKHEPVSVVFASLHGTETRALTVDERFQVWGLWAWDLAQDLPPGPRRDLVMEVHKTIADALQFAVFLEPTELIIGVAFKWPDDTFVVMDRPARHHDLIATVVRMKLKGNYEQGFVTSNGRYVNRYEAKEIARKAGQLLPRASDKEILFSEDVW